MSAPTFDLGALHGGLRLPAHKSVSTSQPVYEVPVSKEFILPLTQHAGAASQPVVDIGDPDGNGIMFNHVWTGDILHALHRAVELYQDSKAMKAISAANMKLDFSWEKSAQAYLQLYKDVKSQVI